MCGGDTTNLLCVRIASVRRDPAAPPAGARRGGTFFGAFRDFLLLVDERNFFVNGSGLRCVPGMYLFLHRPHAAFSIIHVHGFPPSGRCWLSRSTSVRGTRDRKCRSARRVRITLDRGSSGCRASIAPHSLLRPFSRRREQRPARGRVRQHHSNRIGSARKFKGQQRARGVVRHRTSCTIGSGERFGEQSRRQKFTNFGRFPKPAFPLNTRARARPGLTTLVGHAAASPGPPRGASGRAGSA